MKFYAVLLCLVVVLVANSEAYWKRPRCKYCKWGGYGGGYGGGFGGGYGGGFGGGYGGGFGGGYGGGFGGGYGGGFGGGYGGYKKY